MSSCSFDKQIKFDNMENDNKQQKINNSDEQLLISAVMKAIAYNVERFCTVPINGT